MKVLWFCNTAANGSLYLQDKTIGSGGWISSLDKALQNEVELHIAFYHPKPQIPFKFLSTTYYPIYNGYSNWKINAIVNNFIPKKINAQDLPIYLNIIEEVQPDLIHIHGSENPFSIILPHTKFPVVISIQGNITICRHKYFSGIDREYSKDWPQSLDLRRLVFHKSFESNFNVLEHASVREIKNLKKLKHVIGRTDWDRRIIRIFAPKSEYYHCDEMLRDGFYQKSWDGEKEREKLVIHTTSSNTFYKGFETLCHSLNLLNNLGVELEWRVAGISPTDPIVKAASKQLKGQFPQKGLKLLGKLEEHELIDKMLEASLYIIPSHIENSPNSLCEAMILGMPCIGTFAGGTSSMLKNGEEGILVQDGDPWALAGAIIEYNNDTSKAIAYGKKARETALKRHNKEEIVRTIHSIYQEIIS